MVEQLEQTTLLTVRTDQSGMIGLIRHLHGLGLMLLSVNCQELPPAGIVSDGPIL
jgi:hypothetical protein